jgi:hypothetical protein
MTAPRKLDKRAKATVRVVDPELKAEIKAFFETTATANIKGEADLIRNGVRYYLRDYKRAGGLVDGHGFPVLPAAGAPPPKPR